MLRMARMAKNLKCLIATAGILVGLGTPIAHAADPWPSDGQNSFNWRFSATGAPPAGKTPELRKLYEVQLEGAVSGTPILGDNNGVYVGTEAGTVYGLPQDRSAQGSGVPDGGLVAGPQGLVFWAQFIGGPVRSSVLKVGDRIYAVANVPNRPRLVALNAQTGDIAWSRELDNQSGVDSCAAPQYSAAANLVIVGLADCTAERANASSAVRGAVVAVDAGTGAVAWKSYLALPGQSGAGVKGTPIVWDAAARVYVATGHAYGGLAGQYTDSLLQLDLANGNVLDSFQAYSDDSSNNGLADLQKRVGFSSTPIAVGRTTPYIGAGAQDGRYYLVNAQTMDLVASPQLTLPGDRAGITASSAWSRLGGPNGTIFGATQTPTYYFGLNPDSGAIGPVFPSADLGHSGPVTFSENYLWSASLAGTLDVHSPIDGHLVWRVPIGSPTVGGVSFAKDRVFVAIGIPGGTQGGLVVYQLPKK